MLDVVKELTDMIEGKGDPHEDKTKPKRKRSPHWRKERNLWVKYHPECTVCLSRRKIEVHHIIPFHVNPELELDDRNFMTLCENKKYGICCHQLIGHYGNYRKFNPNVMRDAIIWHHNIKGNWVVPK